MNKVEKRFRLYAILVIFILLTVLLAVINVTNFTMVAQDADRTTQMIADRAGSLEGMVPLIPGERDFRMGPMGPDSPETGSSARYFTIAFSDKGKESMTIAYRISAVSEEEAHEWAAELRKEETGWTRGTYRYRVYKVGDRKFVTVVDFGAELLPSYRLLVISAVGEVLCLVIGWFLLLLIGKKVYAPIEEADRKQRNFIKNADREFRLPLTVISGNTELLERRYGPDDETISTRRQISKLNSLVDRLGSMGIINDEQGASSEIGLSDLLQKAIGLKEETCSAKGLKVTTDIAPGMVLKGKPEEMGKAVDEIVLNAVEYALTKAEFILKDENGHIVLETRNDTTLKDGPADQVFDRFTVLENGKKVEGAGLGLAYVKDIVKAHKGRVSAMVSGGIFILRVTI
jgi:hypothetical protein